ncbi:hypothetical protein HET69_07860 [Streptomyces sp. CJ_13]|uniref:YidB family protein n=1 Tax=Streptomyces sp. CJ_13 TaxID=2724943 RepID=UPI001BDC329E|nr:YidB family protein [Streptomyces sp. CJ_13]MBT1183931.1 hypothetical protein [Streptomyces sp. CJ_13]
MDNSVIHPSDGDATVAVLSLSAEGLLDAGLEPLVQSWIGQGTNEAVTAEQITLAIGEDQLAQAAESLGGTPSDLAAGLAAELPELIDAASSSEQITPDVEGKVPDIQIRITPRASAVSGGDLTYQGWTLNASFDF